MADLSIPPDFPLRVPQGADWPGISIPVIDSAGVPRTSLTGCTALGRIRRRPDDELPLFTWSTTPAAGQGLITLVGGEVQFGVTAAQSALWTWQSARWQVDLIDPLAPAGMQDIRVGQGVIVLDPDYIP